MQSMTAKLRKCRQSLTAALDEATKEVPELECCLPISPRISGPVIYVSSPISDNHPEILHYCSLCLVSHNETFRYTDTPEYSGQGSRHRQKHFSLFETEAELLKDLPGLLEASSAQTLEELAAKLEFENELNRVCNRLKLTMNTQLSPPPSRGHSMGSPDSGFEEEAGERDVVGAEDELSGLLDMVLEMEQDYDFCYPGL